MICTPLSWCPISVQDKNKIATDSRKRAMLWFQRVLKSHITNQNGTVPADLQSENYEFNMVIINKNHVIVADNSENPNVWMPQTSMQITIAVSASEFGTSSSDEIKLLESEH